MPARQPSNQPAPSTPRRSVSVLGSFARAGFALSAALFGLNLAWALPASGDPIDLVNTRGIKISPSFGDSSTEIALTLTSPDNICPGDTTTGNFRWTTFMMPVAVDMATMTYNSQGPIAPRGVSFASPLFSFSDLAPLVDRSTADGTARIVGTTTVGFRGFTPGRVAAGQYKIGYACIQEPSPGRPAITHRFWQFILTITPSPTGGPAQFVWTSETLLPTTTSPTTSAPTSTVAPTSTLAPTSTVAPTSTLVPATTVAPTSTLAPATTVAPTSTLSQGVSVGVTSTTAAPATTTTPTTMATGSVTTTSAATTTTALVASAAAVPATAALPAGAGPLSSSFPAGSALPRTGSSHVGRLMVSGLLFVYFGSVVVVTSRRRHARAIRPR